MQAIGKTQAQAYEGPLLFGTVILDPGLIGAFVNRRIQ